MKEKPIPFSGPMVQALLEGRKCVTRRIIKPQPLWIGEPNVPFKTPDADPKGIIKPRYQPGDRLWVQETWKCIKYDNMDGDLGYGVEFKDGTRKYFEFEDQERFHQFGKFASKNGWQSPYFMPKEAARIWLEVVNTRPERLQELTEEDAIAEGCEGVMCGCPNVDEHGCTDCMNTGWVEPPQVDFMYTWDRLNSKRGVSFESNPYVWVYEFKRMKP